MVIVRIRVRVTIRERVGVGVGVGIRVRDSIKVTIQIRFNLFIVGSELLRHSCTEALRVRCCAQPFDDLVDSASVSLVDVMQRGPVSTIWSQKSSSLQGHVKLKLSQVISSQCMHEVFSN